MGNLDHLSRSIGYMTYDDYLWSQHWRTFRARALRAYGERCGTCGSMTALDVHHLTYVRLGREMLSDVTVLCRRCHGARHGRGMPVVMTVDAAECPPGIDDEVWCNLEARVVALEHQILQVIADSSHDLRATQVADAINWTNSGKVVPVLTVLRQRYLVVRKNRATSGQSIKIYTLSGKGRRRLSWLNEHR